MQKWNRTPKDYIRLQTKVVYKCPVFSRPEAFPHPSDQNLRNAPSLLTCVKCTTTGYNRSFGIRNC